MVEISGHDSGKYAIVMFKMSEKKVEL